MGAHQSTGAFAAEFTECGGCDNPTYCTSCIRRTAAVEQQQKDQWDSALEVRRKREVKAHEQFVFSMSKLQNPYKLEQGDGNIYIEKTVRCDGKCGHQMSYSCLGVDFQGQKYSQGFDCRVCQNHFGSGDESKARWFCAECLTDVCDKCTDTAELMKPLVHWQPKMTGFHGQGCQAATETPAMTGKPKQVNKVLTTGQRDEKRLNYLCGFIGIQDLPQLRRVSGNSTAEQDNFCTDPLQYCLADFIAAFPDLSAQNGMMEIPWASAFNSAGVSKRQWEDLCRILRGKMQLTIQAWIGENADDWTYETCACSSLMQAVDAWQKTKDPIKGVSISAVEKASMKGKHIAGCPCCQATAACAASASSGYTSTSQGDGQSGSDSSGPQ